MQLVETMRSILPFLKLNMILGLLLISGCTALLNPTAIGQQSPHLFLGNPSGATPFNANDYLIVRPQYALGYNRNQGIANWASWQLNQSWLGNLPRPEFTVDSSLPAGWYRVQPRDYSGSGFDRGHWVPAADRNRVEADSQATFLMTNIFPQAPDNNQGPWEKLESYCRTLVRQGKELYIIAGGIGEGGVGMKGQKNAIGSDKIRVPAKIWKIVVVLEQPGLNLNQLSETTPLIAVLMPNQQGIKDTPWQIYQTSIDQIEQLTGYDFLSNLSESIQAVLEARVK